MKIFKKWLDNRKNNTYDYPFLNISLINKYEKLANIYNVSLKSRGLEKPITSDEGFLVIYRRLKGNITKLKKCLIKKINQIV